MSEPSNHAVGAGGGRGYSRGEDEEGAAVRGGDAGLLAAGRPREPHEVLGVPRNATPSEIRSAYRRLALLHHPDRIRGAPHTHDADAAKARACARFAEISAAYELMSAEPEEGEQAPPMPGREQYGGVGHHAADAAAGGQPPPPPAPTAPSRPPPPARTSPMPFQYDPFAVFDNFFGMGEAWFQGVGGDGRLPPPRPFGGFSFTDPFRLFRDVFGPGFVPGDDEEEDDSDVEDEWGNSWPGGLGTSKFIPPASGINPGFGGLPPMGNRMAAGGFPFGVSFDGQPYPAHLPAAIIDSTASVAAGNRGMMLPYGGRNGGLLPGSGLLPGASGGSDAANASFSFSSTNGNLFPIGGRTVAMSTSTTTSLTDGRRITKTICETLNADGSRHTTIDVSGDGLSEEELVQRRPDLLDDNVGVMETVPAVQPPPQEPPGVAQELPTLLEAPTHQGPYNVQRDQSGGGDDGQDVPTANLLGLEEEPGGGGVTSHQPPAVSSQSRQMDLVPVRSFQRTDPRSTLKSERDRSEPPPPPGGRDSIVGGSNMERGAPKRRKHG